MQTGRAPFEPLASMDLIDAAVLTGVGDSDPAFREAVFRYAQAVGEIGEPPADAGFEEPMRMFIDKVARHAYKVLPRDIAALKDAGLSEDAIFELTLAAACGAGRARLEAGLASLAEVA